MIKLDKLRPVHPGETLREDVFPAIDMTKTDIAKALGISRQMLHDILTEKKPVTAQMAMRLGKFLGNGPEVWFNLQASYDLAIARESTDVSAIPTYQAA